MTRILIVDDNELNLYLLQVLLQGNGFEVVVAKDGSEALSLARQSPPDLIISDILMPVMDGFALCRECKMDERLQNVPFVFYTATYTESADEEFALSLGADRFMVKPADPDEFMKMVWEVIANHQAGRLTPSQEQTQEEQVYLKKYSEALIRKLEDKMVQLEEANRAMEQTIAELRRAEDALVGERNLLRTLIDALPDHVYVKDLDGNLLLLNQAQARDLGMSSPEEAIGHGDLDLLPAELAARIQANDQKVFSSGDTVSLEEETVNLAGDSRLMWSIKVPLRGSSGEISGLVGVSRDITERKELEERLLQAQKMDAVGRLAGGVAHDFNNILTTIIGYSDFLLRDFEQNDPRRDDLVQIRQSAERAAALTRQLLTFSRRQVIQPKIVDLNSLIAGVTKMLHRLIGEDIDLVVSPSAGLGRVQVDPSQMEQVIINLAVNARDAMPLGGRIIIETDEVDVTANLPCPCGKAQPGRYVMLAVSDTGTGMDYATRARVFEPFFTTKETGTGLGLATVYGIVSQSNGHVTLESEPGRGTIFRVYLPLTAEEPDAGRPRLRAENSERGMETVLVVEDAEDVRRLVSRTLRDGGYTVLEAANGEEALRSCQRYEEPIHLLVTDVVMPGGMSGRQVAETLIALRPAMKCLYISGYTDDAIVQHQVPNLEMEFLEKPFTPSTLLRKARRVLDGSD